MSRRGPLPGPRGALGVHRLVALTLAALVTACGGSAPEPRSEDPALQGAERPAPGDFPSAAGHTLEQLAAGLEGGPQLAPATSTYTPGRNRLAFGVVATDNRLLYGPTVVYLARRPDRPARGPFPAPARSLVVRPPFRSRTAALEGDPVAAIYSAEVALPAPGRWSVLAVTRVGGRLVGAGGRLEVSRRSPVPAVGDPAPRVATDTLASVGNPALLDTRDPPDDMHRASFETVVGRRPAALLFATPALCQTRVCGPVVDIAAQLEAELGDRVEFIHQEVYRDNDPARGLRPPLEAFGLHTEPWLFAVDRRGRVAARLEGSFGVEEFRSAVEAALR